MLRIQDSEDGVPGEDEGSEDDEGSDEDGNYTTYVIAVINLR